MSRQVTANVSVGPHNILTLPGTLPIERLVEELNRIRLDHMNTFTSLVAILADEHLFSRHRISLTTAMIRAPFHQVWEGKQATAGC